MKLSKLSRLLKQSHRKTKSWNITGAAFHITGGMAYRMAMDGYDPANPTIRVALGLGPRVCSKCKRRVTVPQNAPRRIFDMSPTELLWRLKNRS